MAPSELELDDHQKFVLMKFRRSVSDILQPQHNDKFLLRWLRARSWDPEAAEKMLRQSMKWRQQLEVDTVTKTWQPPENFIPYFPHGTTGYSKNGAPVIIVPFAGLDIIGVLHAFGKEDFMRMTLVNLEKYMDLAAQKGGHQVLVIFDMENFNLKQYAWRPAAEVVISMIQMYEANYPEILKACYIINTPRVFAIAFNVVKKFMNEYTLSKIQIFKNDPKKWKKVLLESVDPECLPKHYGGTLVDPDGNPKYTTVVVQGGKVPKNLYKNQFETTPEQKHSTKHVSVVVKKGGKLALDFIVAEEGCFLKWDFRTEDHDIRFGISMKDEDGNITPVVRHKRVAAHQIDESGVIACQAPATYTVVFDNSYSFFKSKKLHYDISITPPLEKLNIVPTDDELKENETIGQVASTSSTS